MLILNSIILASLVVLGPREDQISKVPTRLIDQEKAVKYEVSQITKFQVALDIFNKFCHGIYPFSKKFELFMQRIICKYRVILDLSMNKGIF